MLKDNKSKTITNKWKRLWLTWRSIWNNESNVRRSSTSSIYRLCLICLPSSTINRKHKQLELKQGRKERSRRIITRRTIVMTTSVKQWERAHVIKQWSLKKCVSELYSFDLLHITLSSASCRGCGSSSVVYHQTNSAMRISRNKSRKFNSNETRHSQRTFSRLHRHNEHQKQV